MLAVGSRMRKPFETLWTLEGLLSGVKPFVFSEVVLVLESLVTVRALVRTQIYNDMSIIISHRIDFADYNFTCTLHIVNSIDRPGHGIEDSLQVH